MSPEPTIEFRLDRRSGVPAYRQIIDQVRQALRLGILRPGDQLPTVRDVVKQVAINPNTVHRAYRDLEQQGLTEGRQGSGTFIKSAMPAMPDELPILQEQLAAWIHDAKKAGLGREAITALIAEAMRSLEEEDP
jgi:GntR family transcriptional regulator